MLAMAIRRADAEDLAEILSLERVCHGAPHWAEDIWRELLSPAPAAMVRRAVFVAKMDDELVGFVVVGGLDEVVELESVAVVESRRGQGIGKALCRSGMAWARELGARRMELEVRASSDGVLAMYRSLGFREVGRRRRYYREPEEDAVLMDVSLLEIEGLAG